MEGSSDTYVAKSLVTFVAWLTLQDNLVLFNSVNSKLLDPPGSTLRNIPIKIYLPTTAESGENSTQQIAEAKDESQQQPPTPTPGSIRVVQSLVPVMTPSSQSPLRYALEYAS